MEISARVRNSDGAHSVTVQTAGRTQSISIPPKDGAKGSSVNGGELLFLALATCYCNDLYREANKRGIDVSGVDIEVVGSFGAESEAARDISYCVDVTSSAPPDEIDELIRHTDTVAEIHNTLRASVPVRLASRKPPGKQAPEPPPLSGKSSS